MVKTFKFFQIFQRVGALTQICRNQRGLEDDECWLMFGGGHFDNGDRVVITLQVSRSSLFGCLVCRFDDDLGK